MRKSSSGVLGRATRARSRAINFAVENGFDKLSKAGRLIPLANPAAHRVERISNVPYSDSGRAEHLLDVYRPEGTGPWPVVLYIHGGGFRSLSKDTHWLMGILYARRGYLVFNINYRLAPRDPYPAAIEDVCAAYAFVIAHARSYGGDPDRIIVSGESAGANLATALMIATTYRRQESFARSVWGLGQTPRAVLPMCGLLQVSDPDRFRRDRRSRAGVLLDPVRVCSEDYLSRSSANGNGDYGLADPLCVLESKAPPDRLLPPIFSGVGTWDPILDDTRRLKVAADRLGARCDVRYYPREVHAFHALVWRRQARQCWRDSFSFLDSLSAP